MIFTSQRCIPRAAQRAATLGKQVMSRTCVVRYSALSMGAILFLAPVPATQIIHPDCELKNHVHLSQLFVRKQVRWPPIFWQVFAKNSLIKNISKEQKKIDRRRWFFLENSFVLGVFVSGRRLQANHGIVPKKCNIPKTRQSEMD